MDWDARLRRIEPPLLSDEERAAFARFRNEFRRFNRDAVRREMQSGEAS